jgi:hypothetical protein
MLQVFAPSGRFKGQVESGRQGPADSLNCAININVIQPTPDISPCGSDMQLHRQQLQLQRRALRLAAPLASCGSATLTEPLDDARSIGSDSVFLNSDDYWTGSDDATLCDSCSDDASSENSSADGGATAADACSCCASESPPAHSWTSSATPSPSAAGAFTQGPNVVQCSNQAAAPPARVENFTSSTRELSSHSNKMTEVTSSLVLDQLGNKVDGNNELITETVF